MKLITKYAQKLTNRNMIEPQEERFRYKYICM